MSSTDHPPDADLVEGREAYERGDWRTAHEALSRVDRETPLTPEDLWRLAVAGYLVGREEAFVDGLARAHRQELNAGNAQGAARSAVWLGLHLAERGETAQASGWFGRAARILEDDGGACVEQGYLLLPAGLRHLGSGENEAAAAVAARAAECAQSYGDRDLLALAVHLRGRALLRQGQVAEGLALLDEAMVAVATDELSPQVTGLVYCSVISACRRVYALDRAHEWTAALTDWCEAQPDMVAFRGQCRVFRSELMRMQGAWGEALEEAVRAGQGGSGERATVGAAHYERGEVHRLRGEADAAEEAFRQANRSGREPQPGLALLRLAQGETQGALTALRRALGEIADPLRRARLLPAQVEILLASGDTDAAESACEEMEAIAGSYGTGALEAMAAQARGAVSLAGDDPAGALEPLRRALRVWRGLEAVYDAARTQALLGRACLALGDEDGAAMELDAARAAFDALGAATDLEQLDSLRGRGPADRHGLTPRELEVLSLVATGKTNRAIGDALFISERTVARHVSNIFRKLDLSSRAEATAFAYEHGLTTSS